MVNLGLLPLILCRPFLHLADAVMSKFPDRDLMIAYYTYNNDQFAQIRFGERNNAIGFFDYISCGGKIKGKYLFYFLMYLSNSNSFQVLKVCAPNILRKKSKRRFEMVKSDFGKIICLFILRFAIFFFTFITISVFFYGRACHMNKSGTMYT